MRLTNKDIEMWSEDQRNTSVALTATWACLPDILKKKSHGYA